SWIFFMAAFVGILEMLDDMKNNAESGFTNAICFGVRFLLLITAAYGFLLFISQKGSQDLVYGNTELYYKIYYAANPLL
ncbi:MAG: hypothetical protein IKQ56_08605, partial [Lachnospiraceae bacterium]|nr:hypothetical protein [Lachnospiraceae bacterium]